MRRVPETRSSECQAELIHDDEPARRKIPGKHVERHFSPQNWTDLSATVSLMAGFIAHHAGGLCAGVFRRNVRGGNGTVGRGKLRGDFDAGNVQVSSSTRNSFLDFSVAARTALITTPRSLRCQFVQAFDRRAAGADDLIFQCTGMLASFETIFAPPRTVCAASVVTTSRGKPATTPPSLEASMN